MPRSAILSPRLRTINLSSRQVNNARQTLDTERELPSLGCASHATLSVRQHTPFLMNGTHEHYEHF